MGRAARAVAAAKSAVIVRLTAVRDQPAKAVAAAQSGDLATLTALLDAGLSPNTTDDAGDPLLHWAVYCGHKHIVSLLLDRGVDINQKDGDGETALHYAARRGETDTVDVLIRGGADVNAKHNNGGTALYLAAVTGKTDTVDFLIGLGADIDAKDNRGRTALHQAAWAGRTDTVDFLIRQGADVDAKDNNGWTALHRAAWFGRTDTVDCLIRGGADIDAKDDNGETGLHGAAFIGRTDTVDLLLQRGADIHAKDNRGETALHRAAERGETDTVYCLSRRGADVDAKDDNGRTALYHAAWYGWTDTVAFLIGLGADVNVKDNDGATPLFLALERGAVDSATLLIAKGANVNIPNDDKVTPLAAASESNKHEIVTLLLEHKADPDLADREGFTALHKCVLRNSVESFKLLIAAGVKLDMQTITGDTALHFATSLLRQEMLNMLVKANCNITIENDLGNIALNIAASYRKTSIKISDTNAIEQNKINTQSAKIRINIAKTLLSNKSKIDHRNNYGETPIALSIKALNLEMLKLLDTHRADLKCSDNMHRGLIHKVVEALIESGDNELTAGEQVIKWLLDKGLSINAQDVNLQTALHLAAYAGKKELVSYLIGVGADVTARDSFGHLPLMCALKHPTVFQFLWDHSIKHLNDKDFCTLQCLTYWLGLGDDLMNQIKKDSKTHVPLENMPQEVQPLKWTYDERFAHWLNNDSEELPDFMSDWLSSLQQLTYIDHPTLNDVMRDFLKHLQEGVRKEDPFVAYLITLCGSVTEKTKVFAQDECDCSCVQENIRFDMFEEPTEPDHNEWTAFVHMKCKDEYVEQLSRILDKQNRLSQAKLCHYFGKAIAKVLSKAEFWRRYPQLQRITPKDISAGDRRICTMHVIWSDEICPFLKIDIDLAPVVDLKSWKPSWCNPHPLMHEIDSIALPKWKITRDVEMDLMEIGVHGWGPLFHKMPEQMRQGYRLAKVVRGSAVCPQVRMIPEAISSEGYLEWCKGASEFMNTYLLKQVIMHEFQAWFDQKEEGLEPQAHTDVYWARRIYEKMEEAFKSRELYSWYIPSYNLLTDHKFMMYKDEAIMYAKLCRRLLTEEAAEHFRKAYMGGPVDAT